VIKEIQARIPATLLEQLNNLPAKPGVYLMKDAAGQVIYVGKALVLRNRVRSYFHASAEHDAKMRAMVAEVAAVEFIVTGSELEALILEANLIKKHHPRYNVRLKDDKRYPYIKITWQDDFPTVTTVRRIEQDGARYYGPFTASWAVNETLDLLRKSFPYLTCNRDITGRDTRACLYYHIGRCLGPCIGAVSREEYRLMIDQICRFLEGHSEEVVAELKLRMRAAAERLDFEEAARYRDRIEAITRIVEKQRVVSTTLVDQDVIAFARADGDACVQVFFIRRGKLIGREYYVLEGASEANDAEIVTAFVKQFYDQAAYVPPEILLPERVTEARIIEKWLRAKRGGQVVLRVPQRGEKRGLVQLATENAVETLASLRAQWQVDAGRTAQALAELQEALALPQPPTRMECYDISNIQGTAATGSMVVFVKGVPRKSDYRRFRVQAVEGADDYAMMREVLRRRFRRYRDAVSEPPAAAISGYDPFSLLPDLLVVDGGKGQLNVAVEVLSEFGLTNRVSVAALAKEQEELFIPTRPDGILLPRGSQSLFLIQRLRDEAHRFAVTYHRTLRDKTSLVSQLEAIPGIGPKRRKALLKHFGSVERIRQATVDELAAVPGMTRAAAEQVKASL